MTLIITEISKFGIAMVADSAVTFQDILPSGEKKNHTLNGAQKLQEVPYLSAGISTFGLGNIQEVSTDIWLSDFIQRHSDILSIDDFANQLTSELQEHVGRIESHLGFHLAGFVKQNGQQFPTFYCVRNVDGTNLNYSYHEFVPGHDFPPRQIKEKEEQTYRNGDFGTYAFCEDTFREKILPILTQGMEINIPHPSLQGHIAYRIAWVKFISDLYACSGLIRSIGGTVYGLGISPEGHMIRMQS